MKKLKVFLFTAALVAAGNLTANESNEQFKGTNVCSGDVMSALISSIELSESNMVNACFTLRLIQIDTWVTATNGCKFHITGWIDVGWSGVNGYDIHMDGDCANYHFQGMVDPDDRCDRCEMSEAEIHEFALKLLD